MVAAEGSILCTVTSTMEQSFYVGFVSFSSYIALIFKNFTLDVRNAMLCYAMLCYAMLCYALLQLMILAPSEVAAVYCRLGWLNVYNPCKPEGAWELDMSRR